MLQCKWTIEETDFIKKNYTIMNSSKMGKILGRTTRSVANKLTRTVSLVSNGINNTHRNWKGYKTLSGTEFKTIVHNAKIRHITFDLDIQDVYDLYEKQNGKCNYTGLDLVFNDGCASRIKHNYSLGTVSLDRTSSKLPYQKDNIQIIHKHINKMKNDYSEIQFFDWIRLIVNPEQGNISVDTIVKSHHGKFSGVGNLYKSQWNNIIRHAKDRKIDIFITIEQAWNLFCSQNGCCVYIGFPLYMPKIGKRWIGGTASSDRIDSDKNYTMDNIQWIHKDLSDMKWKFSDSYFREICKLVYDYRGLECLAS